MTPRAADEKLGAMRITLLLCSIVYIVSLLAACDRLPFGQNQQPSPPVTAPPPVQPVQPVAAGQPGVPGQPGQVLQPGQIPGQPVPGQPGVVPAVTGQPVAPSVIALQGAQKPTAPPPPPETAPMQPVAQQTRGRCTNTCRFANDHECDDGRPGAHTSVCSLGTDCGDCGPVGRAFHRGAAASTGGTARCNNTCRYARDGECDDGRPGSHTSVCAPGTDCADCGQRAAGGGGGGGGCTNTCQHANDHECDDGRAGSVTALCARGTDCNDCGP